VNARTIWLAAGVAAIAVVAVVVTIAAGGPGSNITAPGSAAHGARDRVAPISLTTLEGERVELPAGRPGALFFTVSSCLSCIPSGRALGELKAELGTRADAIWIGIDPGDPPAAVRERRRAMGNRRTRLRSTTAARSQAATASRRSGPPSSTTAPGKSSLG
jgi:hypothetical protein